MEIFVHPYITSCVFLYFLGLHAPNFRFLYGVHTPYFGLLFGRRTPNLGFSFGLHTPDFGFLEIWNVFVCCLASSDYLSRGGPRTILAEGSVVF